MTNQTKRVEKIKMLKFNEISGLEKNKSFLKNNTPRVRPKTKEILAMLEPITLPITITALFSRAAKRLVNISGADVPNAMTVEPIKKGESPYFIEDKTEYFSNFCALIHTNPMPAEIYIKVKIFISNLLKIEP